MSISKEATEFTSAANRAAMAAGKASIDGNPEKPAEFLSLLNTFEFWFNIVTP